VNLQNARCNNKDKQVNSLPTRDDKKCDSVIIEYVKVLTKKFIPLEKSMITPTRNNYKDIFSLLSGDFLLQYSLQLLF